VAATRTGLEQFIAHVPPEVRNHRAGLLTNPSGVDRHFQSSVDLLARHPDIELVALFGPEHGIRGEAQAGDHVSTGTDPATGLPVHSLYGETRVPDAGMLRDLDSFIIDIQDIGVRYATYLSSIDNVMTACAEHGVQVVILDRPNPLGGVTVAGGILNGAFRSFVGTHDIPVLHGLTMGEFARLLAHDRSLPEPVIVPMQGWQRQMLYDETGLPWVFPSPNLPTLDSHLLYGATCLIEGTNLSEGRGTTRPFEMIGAPWLEPDAIVASLQAWDLPGFAYRPVYFTPMFSKNAGTRCGGVQIYVTDRQAASTIELGVRLLQSVIALGHDQFEWVQFTEGGARHFVDLLAGGDQLRTTLSTGNDPAPLLGQWQDDAATFNQRRQQFLLYDSTI